MAFQGYVDRAKAQRVWNAYLQDVRRLDLYDRAKEIRRQCKNPTALDVQLDMLVTGIEVAVPVHLTTNLGPDSSWENGVRAYEQMH